MVKRFFFWVIIGASCFFSLCNLSYAVPGLDTGTSVEDSTLDPSLQRKDESSPKSLEEVLDEANMLFRTDRPLDARTKLLKALEIAPSDYRPHMLLGAYYLSEVGHFRLALRYLRQAEELFEKKYGSERLGNLDTSVWQEHARLLYLMSEARLNLDNYEGALKTLDRFGALYRDSWYPGTRAWVLMKLKRVDEAIQVARSGLILGAEPGRTYNILGILLSMKGHRELSLEAFGRAINSELLLGTLGQAATPLNNSGEVYREIFQDDLAEASWLKALQLRDGCDHILPSLNLAILYTDELRLFQAQRTLDDFKACFAQNALRSDTEHRGLLALAEGRLLLRQGDAEKALPLLQQALEREQWFGKIGTNENDLRFAATITMAQTLRAIYSEQKDLISENVSARLMNAVQSPLLPLRAWWYERRAREIALDELENFEDLFIRNTDTMVEYPTLGDVTKGFPVNSFKTRISKMLSTDTREGARPFYKLYLAENLLAHGKTKEGVLKLEESLRELRPIDRLARAQTLALLESTQKTNTGWFSGKNQNEELRSIARRKELFSLLPSHFRYYDLLLPVTVVKRSSQTADNELLQTISSELLERRFVEESALLTDYRLEVALNPIAGKEGRLKLGLMLYQENSLISQATGEVSLDGEERSKVMNEFIAVTFRHKADPEPEPVPELKMFSSDGQ